MPRPLRVLFVTTTYPLRPGDSIPGFVADLARRLVADHGIDVKVIAPGHPSAPARETVDGVRLERFRYALDPRRQCVAYGGGIPDNLKNFPRAKFQLPGFFAAMAAAVFRNLPGRDLIHAHWVEPAFLASAANFFRRLPMVLTVHSLRPRPSRLARRTLPRMNRVLFNSQYTLAQARQKGYACRAQVVHQGYDSSLFGALPRDGAFRATLGIPPQAALVTTLGRMIPVKGFDVLAAACDAILAPRPAAHLLFAGDGPGRAALEASVAASPHRRRIHFPGSLPRRRVAELLADSDVFVNPGVIDAEGRAEGFGITTIEAMASGLPVVGSRVGGLVETIADGATGVQVDPGEPGQLAAAIGRLIDDPALRRRMGDAGRAAARAKFTWPVLAGQVARVYDEVCPHSADSILPWESRPVPGPTNPQDRMAGRGRNFT